MLTIIARILTTLLHVTDVDTVSHAGKEFYLMFMPNIVERGHQENAQALIISNPDVSKTAAVNVRNIDLTFFCFKTQQNVIKCNITVA